MIEFSNGSTINTGTGNDFSFSDIVSTEVVLAEGAQILEDRPLAPPQRWNVVCRHDDAGGNPVGYTVEAADGSYQKDFSHDTVQKLINEGVLTTYAEVEPFPQNATVAGNSLSTASTANQTGQFSFR